MRPCFQFSPTKHNRSKAIIKENRCHHQGRFNGDTFTRGLLLFNCSKLVFNRKLKMMKEELERIDKKLNQDDKTWSLADDVTVKLYSSIVLTTSLDPNCIGEVPRWDGSKDGRTKENDPRNS